jgi:histidine triad (HIT) family protein
MKLLFRLVKLPVLRDATGWLAAYLAAWLPFPKLARTRNLVAFHHPVPGYPVHILIIPRRLIRSPEALVEGDSQLLTDVLRTADRLANADHRLAQGWQLVLNGGAYQEFPQIHFHLIPSILTL